MQILRYASFDSLRSLRTGGMTSKRMRISRFLRFLRIWGARFRPQKWHCENKRPQKTQKPQKP